MKSKTWCGTCVLIDEAVPGLCACCCVFREDKCLFFLSELLLLYVLSHLFLVVIFCIYVHTCVYVYVFISVSFYDI